MLVFSHSEKSCVSPLAKQSGFALISVVVVLFVLAAVAALISMESPLETELVASNAEHTHALYVAQAGLSHAKWAAEHSGCANYNDVPDTAFGANRYNASFAPATSSPVAILATGTTAAGTTAAYKRNDVRIFDMANAQTLEMQPDGTDGEDSWISEWQTTQNRGNSPNLDVNHYWAGERVRTLLKFDVSEIPPAAKITSAVLELSADNASETGGVVDARRLTAAWDEDAVTWNERQSGVPWTTPGGDFESEIFASTDVAPGASGWNQWDVSTLVQAWADGSYANHGVIISLDTLGRGTEFESSDIPSETDRPKLTISYVCECDSNCQLGFPADLLFVAVDPLNLTAQEVAKIDLIESWGYTVQLIGAADTQEIFDNAVLANDVAFITEDINSGTLNTKLTTAPIGVVTEEDNLSDEFGMASGIVWDNGSALTITDNSHYISSPFELGPLTIMATSGPLAYMQGSLAPNLSQLADSPAGQPALVALEVGESMVGGGTAAGRRALLPWGGNDFDLSSLSSDGRLIMQRALEWAAAEPPAAPTKVLFAVPDSASLDAQDTTKKALIEGWGFALQLISATDTQANFDAAVATAHVAYISENIVSSDLGTKLRDATIGVVDEEGALYDEFGIASSNLSYTASDINVADNLHYITSPFNIGLLTIVNSGQELKGLTGTVAPGIRTLAEGSGAATLVAVQQGAPLYDSGTAAGRRVTLPWGGNPFDINALNPDGKTIMRRALEWAAGIDSGGGGDGGGGPVAHWKLDDGIGSTAIDSSGNGHNGTLAGNPSWTDGIAAGALDFDGAGDYVDGGNVLAGGTPTISVTAWVFKRDSGDDRLVSRSSGTSIPDHIISLGVANTTIRVRLRTTDNGGSSNYDGGTMSLNEWTHLAFTYDGTNLRIYRNGSEIASFNVTGPVLASDLPVVLGNLNTTQDRYLNGVLDDVRIYNRALSPGQIAILATVCNDNVADDFEAGNYAGSTGSLSWSTDWLEIGESDGPNSGDEQIVLYGNQVLRIQDNDGGGEGAEREADLSAYTNALLSIRYWRDGLDGVDDYVTVEVSSNGGVEWTEVGRIEGPGSDAVETVLTENYDITSFIATNTRIRILSSPTMGPTDAVYFDDIDIQASGCAN
jgi:Tfp pilus assembly protein PilV